MALFAGMLRAEGFAAHGQLVDKRGIDINANPHFLQWNRYAAAFVHRPRLSDDIAVPIARTRRQVTRQREVRKRRESDVVRPADSRFEHATAPDWNSGVGATVVNGQRLLKATNPSGLEVNDASAAECEHFFGAGVAGDAFVEADGRR